MINYKPLATHLNAILPPCTVGTAVKTITLKNSSIRKKHILISGDGWPVVSAAKATPRPMSLKVIPPIC
jgi:hypothetical protein